MTKTDWPKEPLTTANVHMLHGVLVDWCRNNDCDTSSDRGRLAAKALVGWHDSNSQLRSFVLSFASIATERR